VLTTLLIGSADAEGWGDTAAEVGTDDVDGCDALDCVDQMEPYEFGMDGRDESSEAVDAVLGSEGRPLLPFILHALL